MWNEIGRRASSGRFSPTELDRLAAIAVAELEAGDRATFEARTFLDIKWAIGRLSPQRQRECLRLAYDLRLERRGDRAVLVASGRLHPRPSPTHFPRLAVDRLTIDGRPGPPIHRIVEDPEIPYQKDGQSFELDLGEVPAGARAIAVEVFVLSSPFARGTADWEPDTGILNVDPGTPVAPFTLRWAP